MSLLVFVGVVTVAALAVGVGWTVERWSRQRSTSRPSSLRLPAGSPALPLPASAPRYAFQAFGVALGDVLMLRNAEAWITGAVRLTDSGEDEVGLFFTNMSVDGDVVLIRPFPNRALYLVRCIDLPHTSIDPHTIEHERELFSRRRSIPVAVESYGKGCPAVSSPATWAWFDSPGGDVLVCLFSDSGVLAWRGAPMDEGSTLRLAAGAATFRE